MENIWVFLIFLILQSYVRLNFGHSLLQGCSYPNYLGWSLCAGLAECWQCYQGVSQQRVPCLRRILKSPHSRHEKVKKAMSPSAPKPKNFQLNFSLFCFPLKNLRSPADFLDAMKRDSCCTHISLHLNYSLKIKNDSLISLFDVAFKLKATASSSNVGSELLQVEKSLLS